MLVCRDGDEDEVLADGPALAERLGPLLGWFAADHVGAPELLVCLYGPPLRHVDLKFVPLAALAKRVEDGAVLWDRSGEVAEAFAATPAGAGRSPTRSGSRTASGSGCTTSR